MNHQIYKLENGSSGIFWNASESNTFTISFAFVFREKTLRHDVEQLPHTLEHLIYTGKLRKFRETGAATNASTNQNYVEFFCTLPNEYFREILDTYVESFREMKFTENDFIREKNAVESELNTNRSQPMRRIYKAISAHFLHDPINSNEDTESLKNITFTDTKEFFDEFILPENMKFFIAGDFAKIGVSQKEILAKLETFSRKNANGNKFLMQKMLRENSKKTKIILDENLENNSDAKFAYSVQFREKLTEREVFASRIIAKILNSNDKNSFFNMYRQRKMAYSLYTFANIFHVAECPRFELSGGAKLEDIDGIVELFREKLKDITEGKSLTDEDFAKYLTALRNQKIMNSETSREIAQENARRFYITGKVENEEKIAKIDVEIFAKKMLETDETLLIIAKS